MFSPRLRPRNQGTRGPLGSNFGSDTNQAYHRQIKLQCPRSKFASPSGRLEFSAGYTYSRSMDNSSNLGEQVNPLNPQLSYALSAFDIRHNFVVSYNIGFPLIISYGGRLTGWRLDLLRSNAFQQWVSRDSLQLW